MPIRPELALGVQPVQMPDQMNALAKVMQIKGMQDQQQMNRLQMQEYERGIGEQNELARILRSGVDMSTPDGERAIMAASPKHGAALIKSHVDARNARLTGEKNAYEMAEKGYNLFRQTAGARFQDPNATKATVAQDIDGLVRAGVLRPEVAQALVSGMPDDPAAFKDHLKQILTARIEPAKMLELFAPKPTEVSDGQRKSFRDTNPLSPTYGQNTAGAPLQMQMTPGEVATDARSRAQLGETARHNRTMEGFRNQEVGTQGVTYQQDASGNIVALPTKAAPGAVVRGTPVVAPGAGMQPLAGKPSESISKELTGIRQQNAVIDGALAAVEKTPSAFSMSRGVATMAGAIPESMAGRLDNDDERQARSYVFNNVSKVINERAGAAQSAQELARLRSFLPAETDNAAQIKSKLRAFKTYLGDLETGTRGGKSPSPIVDNDPLGIRKK